MLGWYPDKWALIWQIVPESERRRPLTLISILSWNKEGGQLWKPTRLEADLWLPACWEIILSAWPAEVVIICNYVPAFLLGHTHTIETFPQTLWRQRCWDIVIVQLKSHLKRTTLIISLMLPFGEASQALVFRREMLLDSVTWIPHSVEPACMILMGDWRGSFACVHQSSIKCKQEWVCRQESKGLLVEEIVPSLEPQVS